MKKLSEMTPEQQADCVGMWADVRVAGQTLTEIIGTPPEDGLVTMVDPNQGRTYQLERCHPADITPRLDLLRAWTTTGTPPHSKTHWGVQIYFEGDWHLSSTHDTPEEAQAVARIPDTIFPRRAVVGTQSRLTWIPL